MHTFTDLYTHLDVIGVHPIWYMIFSFQQLPVSIYESVIDLVNGEATMLFVELSYTLATEEAERIGVDHVARVSTNESVENSTGKAMKKKKSLSQKLLAK